jgi:hypothetical protein
MLVHSTFYFDQYNLHRRCLYGHNLIKIATKAQEWGIKSFLLLCLPSTTPDSFRSSMTCSTDKVYIALDLENRLSAPWEQE